MIRPDPFDSPFRFQRNALTVLVDGKATITANDSHFPHGLASLVCGGEGSARNAASYNHLLINAPGDDLAPPTTAPSTVLPTIQPLYAAPPE